MHNFDHANECIAKEFATPKNEILKWYAMNLPGAQMAKKDNALTHQAFILINSAIILTTNIIYPIGD